MQITVVDLNVTISYRFLIASAVLFIISGIKNKRFPTFTREQQGYIFLQGAIFFCINYFFLYWAAEYIVSGLVATAISTHVFMNIFFSSVLHEKRPSFKVITGACLGTLGIVIIFSKELLSFESSWPHLIGLGLGIFGTFLSSIGNFISIANQKRGLPILESTAYAMAYGGLLNASIAFAMGKSFAFDFSFEFIGSLTYLSVIASALVFMCYLNLLGRIGADKAAYAWVTMPAIALLLSTIFEGYDWAISTTIGVACVIVGNILVLMRSSADDKKEIPQLVGDQKTHSLDFDKAA